MVQPCGIEVLTLLGEHAMCSDHVHLDASVWTLAVPHGFCQYCSSLQFHPHALFVASARERLNDGHGISRIRSVHVQDGFQEINSFVWHHQRPLFDMVHFIARDFIQISQHIANLLHEIWKRELFQSLLGHSRCGPGHLLQLGAA